MKNLSAQYLLVSLILSVIVLGYIGALLIFPIRSASDFPDLWHVVNHEVKAGDRLYHQVKFTKHVDRPGTVSIQLVDGYLITLPDQTSNLPKGEIDVISGVEIPPNTPKGEYHLRITITYKNNFVNEDVYVIETGNFTVL